MYRVKNFIYLVSLCSILVQDILCLDQFRALVIRWLEFVRLTVRQKELCVGYGVAWHEIRFIIIKSLLNK